MNLDRWLIRVPPQPDYTEPDGLCTVDVPSSSPTMPLTPLDLNAPPAKRLKLSALPIAPQRPCRALPLPSMARKNALLGEYVPMEMFNVYEARKMRQTQSLSLQTVPFSVTSLHSEPRALIGFQNGCMSVVDTSPNSQGIVRMQIDTGTNSAIRDASVSNDDRAVICGTDLSVTLWDYGSNKINHEYVPEADVGFRQVSFSSRVDVFATGTQSGNVYIMDRRQPQPCRTILNAQRLDKRTVSSISSLAWLNETTLATAGTHNDAVKVWDMRHTRKCLHQSAASQRSGITSMVVDDAGMLWSLRKNGGIFAMTVDAPTYELRSKHVRSRNSYSRLEFISSPDTVGSYLVCSGGKDIVMFVAPSKKAVRNNYDFSSTAHLLKGHEKETTGLHWHKPTNSLLSVADDFTLRYWQLSARPAF